MWMKNNLEEVLTLSPQISPYIIAFFCRQCTKWKTFAIGVPIATLFPHFFFTYILLCVTSEKRNNFKVKL